jgi:phosphate starvation-inducible protein PhoH
VGVVGLNLFVQILEEVVGVEVMGLNLYVQVVKEEVGAMWNH